MGPTAGLPISLTSPAQTTRGKVLDFFVKSQNGLVTLVFEKSCFPGGFRDKISPLGSNHFLVSRKYTMSVIFSSLNTLFEKKQRIDVSY